MSNRRLVHGIHDTPDAFVFERQLHPATVGDLELVMPSNGDLGHFGRNRVLAISGQKINAGTHDEMGAELLRRAIEFVDVVLEVADMNDASDVASEQCR